MIKRYLFLLSCLFASITCSIVIAQNRQSELCADGTYKQQGDCPADLSSPGSNNVTSTTANGTVVVDRSDGTIYGCVTTSATPLTALNIVSCSSGVANDSSPISGAGSQSLSASGLSPSTTYYWQFAHFNPSYWSSDVVVSASFTTPASGGQSFDYAGIPYPTDTTAALTTLGYTPWPYDPTTIQHATLPSPWTANTTGFYYVKTGGSNAGNGFPTSPRGTMPTSLSPGDVVVLSGTFTVASLSLTWNGSTASPVFLIGETGATTDAICRTSDEITFGGSHLVIEGIKFCNGSASPSSGVLSLNGTFQTVRNSIINDLAGFRSGFSSLIDFGSNHTMFYNNTVGPNGDWTEDTQGDNDYHGIKLFGNDHWVINNTFSQVQGDAVQVSDEGGGASPTSAQRVFIAGNTCTQIHQTCFWAKDSTDVIISSNIANDLFDGDNSSTNGAFGGQGDYRDLWIIFNTSIQNGEGVKLASTDTGNSDAFVIGNLIYDQDPQNTADVDGYNNWGISARNGGDKWIVQNTIHNIQAGISALSGGSNYVYGNFVDTPSTYDHLLTNSSVTNDYNCFRGTASLTGTSLGANDITGACDGFTNEAGDVFTLTGSSPMLDVMPDSVVQTPYNYFLSRFGIDLRVDRSGNPRPVNTLHDIGAFERQ